MNKISRLTALLLALMMICSALAAAETTYQVGMMTTDQWQQLVENAEEEPYVTEPGDSGKTIMPLIPAKPAPGPYAPYADGTTTALAVSEESVSALRSENGVAVLTHAAAGQWQMLVGDVWADLSGETGSSLWVTPAMMNGMSTAQFRKALAEETFTQTAAVSVVNSMPAVYAAVTLAEAPTDNSSDASTADVFSLQRANENLEKHLITIEYKFLSNNEMAASSYYAEVSTTSNSFSATVKHPTIVGYQPAATLGDGVTLPERFTYDTTQIAITDASITGNVDIVVYYVPADVKYTVNYWRELPVYEEDPATGEEIKYELITTEIRTGKTESAVKESYPAGAGEQYFATVHAAKGFKALLYDENVKIAADDSTVVDVYYQREYSLIAFKLGGGLGTNPVYARHGAPVGTVIEPTRPGYEFKGWTLNENETVYTDDSKLVDLPDTVPLENVTYYAVWKAVEVNYSITYWLENPNWDGVNKDEQYLYWGSVAKSALTGTVVRATDYAAYTEIENELNVYERRYSKYNEEMTDRIDGDGIAVAGDGSTVLNVFYDRNEYTLRFYYAMSTTNNQDVSTYYVVGGSTYYFGTYNTSNTDNPVKRIDPYMGQGSYKDERGKVDAEPTLNERGLSRNYERGSEPSTVAGVDYDYHYIQFKAKYGQDISNMWPADVFNSVPYTGTKGNGWTGDQAFVSAWNGEYNVHYSHHAPGGNQTIKGNYAELDYQLLWDLDCGEWNHPDKDSELVSYLCFWENGANRGWNVPELYRYNVYVPVFDGDDLDDPTIREYGGVTYKLRERYNTVDNSTVAEQTAPAISGLRYVDREGVKITDYDKSLYNEAWDVFYYYSRETYDLTFSNFGNGLETKTHLFEEDITGYQTYIPQNPPAYPQGAYVFGGWYISPELQDESKYTFGTMPANDVILYAKWEPVTYTVTVYNTRELAKKALDGDTTVEHRYIWDTVQHGRPTSSAFTYDNPDQFDPDSNSFIPPKNEGMTFTYWFYFDENNEEKAFSFSNTPITRDTIVYAGWTAEDLASYTIYYVKDDGNPDTVNTNQDNWVAEPTFGSGLAGATTTERAKGGNDLYPDFRERYFPTLESHSFTLQVIADQNVYVFEYTKKDAVPYQVHYVTEVDPGGAQPIVIDGKTWYKLAPTLKVTDNTKAVVTENYVQVSGNYVPDAFQKRLVLQADSTIEDNVIVFYYKEDITRATVEVNHYYLYADGRLPELFNSFKEIVNLPYTHTITPDATENFVYDPAKTERIVGGEKELNSSLQIDLERAAEGVIVNLYYVEKTVDITYVPVGPAGAADFGSVSPEKQTVGVVSGQPSSTATEKNLFRFVGWYAEESCTTRLGVDPTYIPQKVNGVHVEATYYAKFEYVPGDLKITKTVANNTKDDLTGLEYVFTVMLKDAEGNALPGVVTYAIDGTEHRATLAEGKFTLKLMDGQSAVVEDLPHGTRYEVTEAAVDNCTITFENATGSIEAAQTKIAAFLNTFPAAPVSTLEVQKTGMKSGETAIIEVDVNGAVYMLALSSTHSSDTIVDLPIGSTYTVKEWNNWTWRYDDVTNVTGNIVENGSVVTLDNKSKTDKWLHDESSVINNLGTGNATNINNQ